MEEIVITKKLKVSKAFLWERVKIGDIIKILPTEEKSKVKVSLNGEEPVIMSTNRMLIGLSKFESEENRYVKQCESEKSVINCKQKKERIFPNI